MTIAASSIIAAIGLVLHGQAAAEAGHGWARNLRLPGAAEMAPAVIANLATRKIRRRRVLGGLINEYERAA